MQSTLSANRVPTLASASLHRSCPHPQTGVRHLTWIGYYPGNWEILVYQQADVWEACYVKWDVYHNHIRGFSFADTLHRAEARIEQLEASGECWVVRKCGDAMQEVAIAAAAAPSLDQATPQVKSSPHPTLVQRARTSSAVKPASLVRTG